MKHIKGKKILCICALLVAIIAGDISVYAQTAPVMELSKEEKAYVQEKKTLKVAVAEGWCPIAAFGKKGVPYRGLALDILDSLEKEKGLQIEVIKAKDYPDTIRMVETGEADVAAAVVNYENLSPTSRLDVTEPYLRAELMMIRNKAVDIDKQKELTVARVEGSQFISDRETLSYMNFASPDQCLLAVRIGQADAMFCNIFTGMNYVQKFENRELIAVPVDVEEMYRFGVKKGGDERLINLLNHTIASVSRGERNTSLVHGDEVPMTSLGDIVYLYPFEIICVVLSGAFLVCLAVFLYSRVKSDREVSMHGYEASYRLLADTVGGIGMSYDCIEDRMTIFGDSAELLSIPSQVDKFSVYLEKEEKDISLTKEQLEWMVAEGMVGNEHTIEVKCKTADGSWSHFSLIFSVLYTDKAYYRPISLIGCLMDIEADYSEKEKLRKMSQYDQLTGLYNRAGAEAVMDQYVQKTEGFKNDILVMIDVDDFKNFNDTYGHNCGDDILVYIGSRLQNIFRKDDVLCRWGGDEFYLYLFKAAKNTDRINTRCQELQEEMRQYQYEGKEIPITISIGGVVVGEHSPEDAFKLADQALYSVKKSGRNSVYIVEE